MLFKPEERILFLWPKAHGVEASMMRKLPLTSKGKSTLFKTTVWSLVFFFSELLLILP